MKIPPSETKKMSLSLLRFYITELNKDIKDGDPFIMPTGLKFR